MIVAQSQIHESMALHRYTLSSSYNLPPVYAVPARQNSGRESTTTTNGLSYAEHELLRFRKTPHGRVSERFDSASSDESVYIPASKHVLLSTLPQSADTSGLYSPSERGYLAPMQKKTGDTLLRVDGGRFLHPLPRLDTNTARDPLGGVDSALHQTPLINKEFFYHCDSRVPTALPAAFNNHWGPTASAAQQYFGPYWPDGTFSPYRPAPVRDARFLDPRRQLLSPDRPPDNDFRILRRPGRLPITRDPPFATPAPLTFPASTRSHEYLSFSDRKLGSFVNGRSPYNDNAEDQDQVDVNLAKYPPIPFALDWKALHRTNGTLQPSEASDRVKYRDRSFSWAYHVYVELLGEIQRENKPGKPSTSLSGHTKTDNKPSIYPKPPRRAGSYLKDYSSTAQELVVTRNFPQSRVYRPDTNPAIYRSLEHELPSNTTVSQYSLPAHDQRPRCLYPKSDFQHSHRDHNIFPPSVLAVSALETMEVLCNDTDTPWTDGMLLAGCLAYGLGSYSRALSWYQKILLQDPGHVEAISNLAATLLAVGRRDEALLNWSTAVKLRPSYFEAVEHLIGLLCSANRAKDAVDIIEYVQGCLKIRTWAELHNQDPVSDGDSDTRSQSSSITTMASNEHGVFEYDVHRRVSTSSFDSAQQLAGFGCSGYGIPGSENGRLLALIHAKGNMHYSLGDHAAAASSFENAILIATDHQQSGIHVLIRHILQSCVSGVDQCLSPSMDYDSTEPILLSPERAQQTAEKMFPPSGDLPGLEYVPRGIAYRAAVSTISNSLLSLAKIYQDGMGSVLSKAERRANGTREILALYYLSLSLQRSPSTANNVGILLASVQHSTKVRVIPQCSNNHITNYTGIAPGSGIALALQYYNYGLNIDSKHAHLYTNLGSLLKDLGQLSSAIKMYEIAVQCDGNFDIALANLANAVKDQGRIAEAIRYYRRAVQANPDFAEAVCGLATALNSVCNWYGRGGVYADNGLRDRIHVNEEGKIQEARRGGGWMNRVVEIVDKQLKDGESWGIGTLTQAVVEHVCQQLSVIKAHLSGEEQQRFYQHLNRSLRNWSGKRWEGARVVRLIERGIRQIGWQWYQDRYIAGKEYPARRYNRPVLPTSLSSPTTPTVLPFHTFTTPLSARQVRQISQRNALRISVAALRAPWLPTTVYPPPCPPSPCLNVGYVSSDFNNHPLAHLMQSIFGLHDTSRIQAFCYATTASDGSVHRQKIERESPVFHDTSSWPTEKLIRQIVMDGIHILVNLNGYTRGAKNEVFAARPAPIHMSFMGFAGTLGAEWCDYVFADSISILPKTLSPWRRNVDIEDCLHPDALTEDQDDWIYAENVIFAKSTFFCVDHKQSAPDAEAGPPAKCDRSSRDVIWKNEQDRRWRLRKELFPMLSDTAVILGNFNQLYKIDPATFRTYLRILSGVPNAILWLLRFPDLGEQNLKIFAREWAGEEVASRIIFTDVAPKGMHITRASVVDLFLDTPECNAHTTAADVIWSGTPIITWARWEYKMCSRMASSIVASALPDGQQGDECRADLLVDSDEQYEKHAISLALDLRYPACGASVGRGRGRLMDLRRVLWEGRWTSRLFDTKRWVKDLENAYWAAWRKWEHGEGGDIWL